MSDKFTETDEKAQGHNWSPVAGEQIKSILERVERLEEEKASLGHDIRDVWAEAKGNGFDVKTLKRILKDRKKEVSERQEEEHLYELYTRAIGMLPLESFADEQANRIKITTSTGVIDTDVNTFIKSAKMTDKIINVLGAIYQNGGFNPVTDADTRLVEHLEGMDLVDVRKDGSCMVKPSIFKKHLEKQRA